VKRRATALGVGLVLLGAPAARAQTAAGFALDRFDPSERGSAWFTQDSLDLRGHLRYAAGLVADIAYRPLVLYDPDGSLGASLVRDQYVAHAGASVVLSDRVRVGLNLPVAVYEGGVSAVARGVQYPAPGGASLGDLRLSADARILGEAGDAFTLAAGAELYLPTGSPSQYMSDGTVRATPRVLGAGQIGLLVYAARVGIAIRPDQARFEATGLGSEVVMGAAAGVQLWDRRVVLGPELTASTVVGAHPSAFAVNNTPVELLLGGHARVTRDLVVGVGAAPGLSRGLGEPLVRVLASIEWAPLAPPVPDFPPPPVPLPPPPPPPPATPDRPPPPAVEKPAEEPALVSPLADVEDGQIRLAQPITFLPNTGDLDPASTPVLSALRSLLEAHPEIERVRIEGHTDDQGSFEGNLIVSKKRAKAVVDWLVAHGIAPERLQSQGYGSAKPIAPNTTPEGREENRRIELHIVSPDPSPHPPP
jgi:outer membrane protein OmpA-like peptidoglycan-associated protein